jgi:ribonuclease HII
MPKILPTLQQESQLWQQGYMRVAGADEAGLGSLCGPVVAAAVLLPVECSIIAGVRDSKTLSLKQRELLFTQIHQQAIAVGVGAASVAEIDQLNVLQASYLAMQRALARIGTYDHVLIDGRAITTSLDLGTYSTLIDGDAHCYAIACASIIAKVRRDRLMQRLARRYPGYGWEKNAGYGTQQHLQAMEQHGVTPWHRRSYAPVRKALARCETSFSVVTSLV